MIRKRYPRWVLWVACLLLIVANVFNIAADLGGMGDAMHMVTGIPAYWWTPFFAAPDHGAADLDFLQWMARVFKWLTLVLFAYVITAFLAHPDWSAGASLDVHPACGMDARIHVDAGGNSRNHHFALPVLLAGLAGSRSRRRRLGRTTVAQRQRRDG